MNPFQVIGLFTLVLVVVIYWLQGRQDKVDQKIRRIAPIKEISVIKKDDWVADEEPELLPEQAPELEPVEESEPESLVDDIGDLPGVGPKFQQLLKAAGVTSIAVVAESEPKPESEPESDSESGTSEVVEAEPTASQRAPAPLH